MLQYRYVQQLFLNALTSRPQIAEDDDADSADKESRITQEASSDDGNSASMRLSVRT
jgi:hypothetical protein